MEFYEMSDRKEAVRKATALLNKAVAGKAAHGGKSFALALSGGKTPLAWFDDLAERFELPAGMMLKVYWVDERCVGFDSNESNCGNAWRHWLRELYRQNPGQVHIYPLFLPDAPAYEELQELDMVFLGMGADGHTASWFPGEKCYAFPRGAVNVPATDEHSGRITMTLQSVLLGEEIVFLFFGQEKRDLFVEVWDDDRTDMPVGLLKQAEEKISVIWSE